MTGAQLLPEPPEGCSGHRRIWEGGYWTQRFSGVSFPPSTPSLSPTKCVPGNPQSCSRSFVWFRLKYSFSPHSGCNPLPAGSVTPRPTSPVLSALLLFCSAMSPPAPTALHRRFPGWGGICHLPLSRFPPLREVRHSPILSLFLTSPHPGVPSCPLLQLPGFQGT